MTDRLFVYGTLRTDAHPMHDVLADAARRLGRARARGRLVDLGWYPGLVDDARRWVVGELWQLHQPEVTLSRLDAYEGDEYERMQRPVQLHGGPTVIAWIYLYEADATAHPEIASGDWLAHVQSHGTG